MSRLRPPVAIGLLAAGLLVAGPARAQVAVVSVKSVNALLADGKYLARQAGQEKDFDDFLKELIGDKVPSALDADKPFGTYVNWPEQVKDLEKLTIPHVHLVPVADEKGFLDLLEKQLGSRPKADGDVYRLDVPSAGEHMLRFGHGYGYVGAAAALKGDLPDPAKLFPAGQKPLLVATLHVDRFPKDYQVLLDTVVDPFDKLAKEAFDQALGGDEKAPGENDAQFKQRRELKKQMKEMPAVFKRVVVGAVEQTRQITLTLDVDAKRHELAAELVVVPREGSDLAGFAAYAGRARSQFSYLAGKADLCLMVHLPPPEGKQASVEVPKDLPPGFGDFLGNPKLAEAMQKFMEVAVPTVAKDGLDVCLVTPDAGVEGASVLAGLKVQNGKKLDHLLRDVIKSNLPGVGEDQLTVEWNHARHGEARIHKFKVEGDDEFYVAIRDDLVFWGQGKEVMKDLKAALDGFGKATDATPLAQLTASAKMFAVEETPAKKVPKSEGEEKGLRVRLTGGKDLRLRIELGTHLLKQVVELGTGN